MYVLPCPAVRVHAYIKGRQVDYTKGQLPELIDVIIEEKTSLFVCAVGVPPRGVVDRLHKAGIPVMNVRIIIVMKPKIYLNQRARSDGGTPKACPKGPRSRRRHYLRTSRRRRWTHWYHTRQHPHSRLRGRRERPHIPPHW